MTNNAKGVSLCVAALLYATATMAADGPGSAQARYQKDRAACESGNTNQDRSVCLQEAGAALQAANRGELGTGAAYEKNRMLRCEPLPPGEREDCVRRMNGEGTVRGSVESGGIYRELVTPVVKP